MSAFDPPADASWCPECARERISCAHQEGATVVADGGEAEAPEEHPRDLNTGFYDNETNPQEYTMVPAGGGFNPWTTFIRMDLEATYTLEEMR